ncbi:LysE family translocator [Pseudonocardia bannensis]|uniref:LysE family translocator n=1 Tax=Pseudonocardia bannensis TaxID=630973 RepID=A0A848DCM7_9PSEU|nr:LysE family translocator [Pseudonocardia bannensis]NMH90346.1 LysE family translocator [Pseudonocardia bannensis]
MPTTAATLTFLLGSVAFILVPGPSVLFIVGRALAHGRRAALASVAGNCAGVSVLIVAVAFGAGEVAERSVAAFTVLKLVGAAYLCYLGIHTFRTRGDLAAALGAAPGPAADRRVFAQGVLVGVTNPKAVVLFAAVLPQFADPAVGNPATQMLVLGLLFVLTASVLDSVWGLAAGTARNWFATSPQRLRRLGGAGGLMMIVMGAGLAVSGRRD